MSKLLQFYTGIIVHTLLAIPIFSNAQEYAPGKVIPPSPTASALGQYGNINMGYYNGTPDISVPLYTIKTSDNSLDIVLRYNASGIRVSQDASWVGLGWSLAAGGVITSTKRGADDFERYDMGYHAGPPLPPNNDDGSYQYSTQQNWLNRDRIYFDDVIGGIKDGEPDIFCFNFGKYAGKFVLGKESDGSIVYMADQNNLKVEHIEATNDWRITDADGYKYYFSTKEVANDYFYLNTYSDNVDPAGKLNGFGWSNYNPTTTTAWYLDTITSPRGETITFEYDRKESLSIVSKSEQKYRQVSLEGGCGGGGDQTGPSLQYEYNKYNASRQKLNEPVLQKINFPLGSITFITSTRNDIDYLDENKRPVKLNTVLVKDLNGNPVKRFELSYSYFATWQCIDYTCNRLKLDEVKEYGSDGSSKPPYRFTYRNPDRLANKYSKSIDHWGFNNGKFNSSLLPRLELTDYNLILDGGNREPDIENLYAIDGTLTSIAYPTGGHTDFDYELHDYSNITQQQQYVYEPKFLTIHGPSQGYSTTTTLTVPYDQVVTFTFTYDPDDCTPCSENLTNAYAHLDKDGQTIGYWANQTSPTSEFISDKSMILKAGTYTMTCFSIYGYTTNFAANWKERTLVTTDPIAKGGGIRVKSIINYDNAGVPNIRKFSYTGSDGKSSGKLLLHPNYMWERYANQVTDNCSWLGLYIARFSSTVNAVGMNSKSGIVGYDKVTESFGANGENGKIEYFFKNNLEGFDNYPFMPTMQDPENGKMSMKIVYNAAGTPLQQTEYKYQHNTVISYIKGVKIYIDPYDFDGYLDNEFQSDQIRFYENQSAWMVLWRQIETTYSPTGDPLTVTTDFFYDNVDHKNLTRQEVIKNANEKIITKFKYPSDYITSTGSNSFIAKLKTQHIFSPVIEQQTLIERDGSKKIVSGNFTEYQLFNNSFYKPGTIYKLGTAAPLTDLTESSVNANDQVSKHPAYKEEVFVDAYTTMGNVKQQHKDQDINQSYLWDYKEAFPVAEISNASQSSVAFTSFEADGSGNWYISGGSLNSGDAITGRKSYNLAPGNSITRYSLAAGNYIVSYWVKSGSVSVNNGSGTVKMTKNGWSYIEHTVAGPTVTVSGAATIDELRLYPADAKMTTYTYDGLIGMTSQCDVANKITYFEYDGLSRLICIRDQDRNILKKFCYNYTGQQSTCQ